MKYNYNIHKIEAIDIPDLWFKSVYTILDKGRTFVIDRGSYAGSTRLEFDYFIGHIKNPNFGSGTPIILPDIPSHFNIPNPVDFNYVYGGGDYNRSYIEYIMTPTIEDNESYTYGQRLTKYLISDELYNLYILENGKELIIPEFNELSEPIFIFENGKKYVNQIQLIIWIYKNKGYRNNQTVMQISRPDDCLLVDPPCLRSIQVRIQDNKLHFIIYFRSWDLWSGLPANLAGLESLQQYISSEIGVKQGEMIVESAGLHLYAYAEELAKIRCMKNNII